MADGCPATWDEAAFEPQQWRRSWLKGPGGCAFKHRGSTREGWWFTKPRLDNCTAQC